MNCLKNIVVGLLVSFVGSLPLGYLNVIGLEFYSEKNIIPVFQYLLGVIAIEIIVIYLTLLLAKKLTLKKQWKQRISAFTIVFLLLLAFSFYTNNESEITRTSSILNKESLLLYPLLSGLLLSLLNFAQIPFWFSWNVYLINESYVTLHSKSQTIFYLLGAIIGTFLGMLTLIISLSKVINSSSNSIPLTQYIWILFLVLALFQLVSMCITKKKIV